VLFDVLNAPAKSTAYGAGGDTQLATLCGATGGGEEPPPDDEKPSALGTPVAADVTETSVELTRDPATDDKGIKNYDLFRGTTKVAAITGTTHKETGPTPGTEYTYTVRARDTANQVGPASAGVTVTTAGDPLPAVRHGRHFLPALRPPARHRGDRDGLLGHRCVRGRHQQRRNAQEPARLRGEERQGRVEGGAGTAFTFKADAGTNVGYAQQARVSYALTGDGTFDRVERYRYFATDPVTGWQDYSRPGRGCTRPRAPWAT
jgi:hypothetical protein